MSDEEGEEEEEEEPADEDLIKQVFQVLDVDGNGYLSCSELLRFGKAVGFEGDEAEWKEEWSNFVSENSWDQRKGPDVSQFIKAVTTAGGDFYCGKDSLPQVHEEFLKEAQTRSSNGSIEKDDDDDDDAEEEAEEESEKAIESAEVSPRREDVPEVSSDVPEIKPKRNSADSKNRDEFINRLFKFLDTNADNFVQEQEMRPFAKAHHNIPSNDMQWAIEFASFCTSRGLDPDKGLNLKAFKEVLADEKSEVYCDDGRVRKILLELAPAEVVDVEGSEPLPLDKGTTLVCKEEEATLYASITNNPETLGEVMPGEKVVMTGPITTMEGLEMAPVQYGDKKGFVELDYFQAQNPTAQRPGRPLIETTFSILDTGKTGKLGEPELFRLATAMNYKGTEDDFWDEYKPLCMRHGAVPDAGCNFDQFEQMILDDRSLIRCHAAQLQELNALLPKSKVMSKRPVMLHSLFEVCDMDGDKYLSCEEFLPIARGIGFPGSDEDWVEEFASVCEDAKCDKNKGINFNNFKELLNDEEGDYRADDSELSSLLDSIKPRMQRQTRLRDKELNKQKRYARYGNVERDVTGMEMSNETIAATKIQAYHRGNAAREHVQSIKDGGTWDTCVCGHAFGDDDKVCKECGKKRPHKQPVVHCAARGEIIREIFNGIDKDRDKRLQESELIVFAKQFGFSGTNEEWTEEFGELCEDYELDRKRGVDLVGFMKMLNDYAGVLYCTDDKLNEMYRDLVATKGFGPMIDHMNALLPNIVNDDEKLASLAFKNASLNGVTEQLAEMKVVDNSSITTKTVGDNLKKMQYAQGMTDDLSASQVHDELSKITLELKDKKAKSKAEQGSDAEDTTEDEQEDIDGDLQLMCKCGYEFLPGQRFCRRCGKERQDVQKCPSCNAAVPLFARECKKCGQEIQQEDDGIDICEECGEPYDSVEARFCKKCGTPRPICDDQCECGAFWQTADQRQCIECGAPRFDEKRQEARKRESYLLLQQEREAKRERTRQYLMEQDNRRREEFEKKKKGSSNQKKGIPPVTESLPPGSLVAAIADDDETMAIAVIEHPKFNLREAHSRDNRGCTLLHCAAERGLAGICRSLVMLKGYRDVGIRDSEGWTALHRAARNGHAPVVKLLVAHPLLNKPDNIFGRDQFTCLHCSAMHGFSQAVKSILDCPKFIEVNAIDLWGRTALHCAAEYGHADACKVMLDHERFTNVEAKTKWGRRAADVATGKAREVFGNDITRGRASLAMSLSGLGTMDLPSAGGLTRGGLSSPAVSPRGAPSPGLSRGFSPGLSVYS